MGKLLLAVWHGCVYFSVHTWRLAAWLAAKLWDWGAVFFIVTALWTFGAIGIGAAVAEPIPSAMEVAGAGLLILLGGLLLLARTVHAAWTTSELSSAFQRVSATALTMVVFAASVRLGGQYLSEKVPILALDLAQYRPLPIGPPSEPPPIQVPRHQPTKEPSITVSSVTVRVPSKAGDDATASIGFFYTGPTAVQVTMVQEAGVQDVKNPDVPAQTAIEERLWKALMESKLRTFPLELPANNKTTSIPMAYKSVTQPSIDAVNSGSSAYYFLCQIRDMKGKELLNMCFYSDSKGSLTYCRSHN